ncbi:tRNA threonylcarbamoyladenosine biosynthesis protein TsaE [Neolewinella xylanilytica]|uniref:tRNA threonylcarbamoyladenosine biosynthesis protein TsaE n=1 Tax=Neolewinella xylanilytica TaxID=1514080 RepID=A0A2S6I819_9BACT|nr:tRNA (adenosine(37)-N6)-threonylcarbamoyltransferase complex ATPase subunit type 1 TsaE [Neolewinella xylanilytica]PPK87646.1 tRNA threonylcarbamoyladenosine biosynthesis protein TsaE [Neolewinella xylanilytica]
MKITYALDAVPEVAARLLREVGTDRIYALEGALGAGKTTLVREICRQLGVTDPVSSPTFSIVNTYSSPAGVIYHLDCYRLECVEEAIDAGIEELLETAESAVFVEWPAVIEPLLPDDVVFLRFDHDATDPERRHLQITTG